jgi:hypothetical protein
MRECVSAVVRECGSELRMRESVEVLGLLLTHSRTHALTHFPAVR